MISRRDNSAPSEDAVSYARTVADHDPATLPACEGFAWTASLSHEERREMRHDYAQAIEAAVKIADWSLVWQRDYEWRATAAALRDPALTARLLEPRDAHLEVSLTRP